MNGEFDAEVERKKILTILKLIILIAKRLRNKLSNYANNR